MAEFVRLFNEGRFFDAHEVLELSWLEAEEDRRDPLQGLVQVAVALEHHHRGNPEGARKVLDRARDRFSAAPRLFDGIDLQALLTETGEHLGGTRADPPRLPETPGGAGMGPCGSEPAC